MDAGAHRRRTELRALGCAYVGRVRGRATIKSTHCGRGDSVDRRFVPKADKSGVESSGDRGDLRCRSPALEVRRALGRGRNFAKSTSLRLKETTGPEWSPRRGLSGRPRPPAPCLCRHRRRRRRPWQMPRRGGVAVHVDRTGAEVLHRRGGEGEGDHQSKRYRAQHGSASVLIC